MIIFQIVSSGLKNPTYLAERSSIHVAGMTTMLLTVRHSCCKLDVDVMLQRWSLVKLIWFFFVHRIVLALCLLYSIIRLDCQHLCLQLLYLAILLRFLNLIAALAFASDVGKRCCRVLLLNRRIALLGREGLVFMDDLRLENTLCDIHCLSLFVLVAIQIL